MDNDIIKHLEIVVDGKSYTGELLGIDDSLNIIINNVSGIGENIFKVVLNGTFIKEVKLTEKPFDLKALADRLEKVFPGLVRVRDEVGAILVMDKIKVTEQGVVEGIGLASSRAKAVYDEFVRESKKK